MNPIEFKILQLLASYYTLTRAQIGRLSVPDDFDGRVTRRHLVNLRSKHLLNRTFMEVSNPESGLMGPVYYPSKDGCAFLAQECGDDKYRTVCTLTPQWQSLCHWVRVAESHILLDQAVAKIENVAVSQWFGEWDIVNPEEREPQKRFCLYTLLRESPKLVCVPDAAFLVDTKGNRKVFYLEQDRDTTKSAERVASHKCGGYAELANQGGHRRHFPAVNMENFSVLMIAPSERRRDALRKAVMQRSGAKLWKFASLTDLTAETMLVGNVWHSCDGSTGPLLKLE